MKYKVGDRVRIKNLDWYYENRDKIDQIDCGNVCFVRNMATLCGKIVTISSILPTLEVYRIKEDDGEFNWTDEMIERLVERNGKTYPYKIGDRVVLKGKNRCATITDLKYDSFGNLSYYINIDNDKDNSIVYPTNLLLPYDNKVEGLVEEKTKPKFKVGDRIITDTNMKGKIIEDVEEGWYRVEFEPYNNIPQPNGIVPEESMSLVEEEVGLVDKFSSRWVNEFNLPKGYIFKDENGNVINTTKIVLEKKKKEYPKTYEECNRIMGVELWNTLWGEDATEYEEQMEGLMYAFIKLKVCRDAYWKIAGEEMGLGKPWKPDWTDQESPKYCITSIKDQVEASKRYYIMNTILAFPTEEMRNAFYENFKELIESCKELL